MDSKQRYTEESSNVGISLTQDFHFTLHTFDWDIRVDIMKQLSSVLEWMTVSLDDETYYVGGVSLVKEPFFFVIEYYNDPLTAYTDTPMIDLVDILEIDCDQYLDLINESNTIKQYGNRRNSI
jgi:hypothetical protein